MIETAIRFFILQELKDFAKSAQAFTTEESGTTLYGLFTKYELEVTLNGNALIQKSSIELTASYFMGFPNFASRNLEPNACY